jgi:hypothetical protein
VEGLEDIKTGEVYSYGAHQVFVPNTLHSTISKYYELIYSFRDTHRQPMTIQEFLEQTKEKSDSQFADFADFEEYKELMERELENIDIAEPVKEISRPLNPPPMRPPTMTPPPIPENTNNNNQ